MKKEGYMNTAATINSALEMISQLNIEEQSMIAEIVANRVREERRKELKQSVEISRKEYKEGKIQSGSVDDFLKSIDTE